MSKKTYHQLKKEDRELIEDGLKNGLSASEIASRIGVSQTSVTREIKRNRRDDGYRKAPLNNNLCVYVRNCDVTALCTACFSAKGKCSACKNVRCKDRCALYAEDICEKIASYPYTCNGCASAGNCRKHRFRYSARDAQVLYESRARTSREGLDVTEEEMAATVAIIKEGLRNNQGLTHIYAAHEDEMAFSKRSAYRHIKNDSIPISPLELPKQVRYKPRKKSHVARETIPPDVIDGRRYSDFLALPEEQRAAVVEMDCIVGPLGSTDAILTLHFKVLHFQIGIKLEHKDTWHVVKALNWLYKLLGHDDFSSLFGLLLTDRGVEFYDAPGMESFNGQKRTSVYYCDARRSEQKGACEKNHVEVRKIIPKGTSLADISAYELAEVFSHINSLKRKSLFGKAPLELALAVFPEGKLDEMSYHLVKPDEVNLTPALLKNMSYHSASTAI